MADEASEERRPSTPKTPIRPRIYKTPHQRKSKDYGQERVDPFPLQDLASRTDTSNLPSYERSSRPTSRFGSQHVNQAWRTMSPNTHEHLESSSSITERATDSGNRESIETSSTAYDQKSERGIQTPRKVGVSPRRFFGAFGAYDHTGKAQERNALSKHSPVRPVRSSPSRIPRPKALSPSRGPIPTSQDVNSPSLTGYNMSSTRMRSFPEMDFDFGFGSLFQKLPITDKKSIRHFKSLPRIYPVGSCIPEIIMPIIEKEIENAKRFWSPDTGNKPAIPPIAARNGWKNVLKKLNIAIFGEKYKNRCIEDDDVPDLLRFLETLAQDYFQRCRIRHSAPNEDIKRGTLEDIENCLRVFLKFDNTHVRAYKFRKIKDKAHQQRESKWLYTFNMQAKKYQKDLGKSPFSITTNRVRNYYSPVSEASINVCQFQQPETDSGHKLLDGFEIKFDGTIRLNTDQNDSEGHIWGESRSAENTPPGSPDEDSPFKKGSKLKLSRDSSDDKVHITISVFQFLMSKGPRPTTRYDEDGRLIVDDEFTTTMEKLVHQFSEHVGTIILGMVNSRYQFDGYHVLDLATILLTLLINRFAFPENQVRRIDGLGHCTLSKELWQPVNAIFVSARNGLSVDNEVQRLTGSLNDYLQMVYGELSELGLITLNCPREIAKVHFGNDMETSPSVNPNTTLEYPSLVNSQERPQDVSRSEEKRIRLGPSVGTRAILELDTIAETEAEPNELSLQLHSLSPETIGNIQPAKVPSALVARRFHHLRARFRNGGTDSSKPPTSEDQPML